MFDAGGNRISWRIECHAGLLNHWASKERFRRLFFCQREAVETIIYLTELRIPGRSTRTGFKKFDLPMRTFSSCFGGKARLLHNPD